MEIKEVQLNRLDGERQDGEELSAKNPLVPRRRFPRKVIFSIALATIILLAGLLVFFTPSKKVLIRIPHCLYVYRNTVTATNQKRKLL